MQFMTCKIIFLCGPNFTASPSVANLASRSVKNYPAFSLPETFEELQKVQFDRPYNFLMSSRKESIDKEIGRLG